MSDEERVDQTRCDGGVGHVLREPACDPLVTESRWQRRSHVPVLQVPVQRTVHGLQQRHERVINGRIQHGGVFAECIPLV